METGQSQHTTVLMTTPSGHSVDIDAGIADLIKVLWDKGWETCNSCEDNFRFSLKQGCDGHYVWIEFINPSPALNFIQRFVGVSLERFHKVQYDWDIDVVLSNVNITPDGDDKSPPVLMFGTSVRFPIADLVEVKQTFGL